MVLPDDSRSFKSREVIQCELVSVMAQALAEPGDTRHGFKYIKAFDHGFVRITSMATTKFGNVLLCDYDKKQLVLVDTDGGLLKICPLESNPYDVAVIAPHRALVTLPVNKLMLHIDPNRLLIHSIFTPYVDRPHENVKCLSTLNGLPHKYVCSTNWHLQLGNTADGVFGPRDLFGITCLNEEVVKIHARKWSDDTNVYYCCTESENPKSIMTFVNSENKQVNIPTLTLPSDICSDDNGHIYVSGMYSHNIHRLTENVWKKERYSELDSYQPDYWNGKVLDIPLSSEQKLNYPVAMCFNQDYTKFYVANDWGESVLIFDVV